MIGSFTQRKRRPTTLSLEQLESRDCPAYSIVDLLPAAGGLPLSQALGLNDSGLAVGSTSQVSGHDQATVWPAATGSTRAGTFLPMLAGSDFSEAVDVNNAGMIAGHSSLLSTTHNAVVWIQSGGAYGVHDLGSLGGSFTNDGAAGLSEADALGKTWVVGESWYVSGNSNVKHATVWRLNADAQTLSTIDLEKSGPGLSLATDVRVVGATIYVSGIYSQDAIHERARVWTLDLAGQVLSRTDLGTLGGLDSAGHSIDQHGHVVGSSTQTTDGPNRGFIYRNGSMTSLGSLGNKGSWAAGINDSDTVVGTYLNYKKGDTLPGGSPYAFVWQNNTMRDLRGQLDGPGKSAWTRLQHAADINATGQIVGSGNAKVGTTWQYHGYLATPPALHADAIVTANDTSSLSSEQVAPLLAEAAARWQAAGIDTSPVDGINLRIADLGGTTLGIASGNTIYVDDNAAGWGWFVDPTPSDDAEFTTPGDQGEQNRMDLHTVLMHEIGHVLGQEHDEGGVMAETLSAGTRLTPHGVDVQESWWLAGLPDLTSKRNPFGCWL